MPVLDTTFADSRQCVITLVGRPRPYRFLAFEPSWRRVPLLRSRFTPSAARRGYGQGISIHRGRTMKIENVYRPGPVACRPTDSLSEAARRMHTEQVGALAVCDDGRLDQLVASFQSATSCGPWLTP